MSYQHIKIFTKLYVKDMLFKARKKLKKKKNYYFNLLLFVNESQTHKTYCCHKSTIHLPDT